MAITTTTRLSYTILRGQRADAVIGTITSTPGFVAELCNMAGLKMFPLLFTVVGLGLVASLRADTRLEVVDPTTFMHLGYCSYPIETFMFGEVFFLCVHSAALTCLAITIITYMTHSVSSIIIVLGSIVELCMNAVLSFLLFTAGVVELHFAVQWRYEYDGELILQSNHEFYMRIAAGVLALINSFTFGICYAVHRYLFIQKDQHARGLTTKTDRLNDVLFCC